MSIKELPTVRRLRRQMTELGTILEFKDILRCIGLDSTKIAELQDKYNEMCHKIAELTEYHHKFNKYFLKDGWLAHDSMNFDILKQGVDEYESRGRDNATAVLLDYYGPDQVEQRLLDFLGADELRIRRKFIDYALVEHKAGRYYSAIPLLLMVIDGAFNDATGKGFHASDANLDVWDSLTTADGAIYEIKGIFRKGRKKTCIDSINLPYRNGILHGMDLGYDNPIVAAKCWCFLFVVRDWLASKKSEADRKGDFAEETRTPTLSEIVDKLEQANRLKLAIKSWKPRTISAEYLHAINSLLVAEDGLPESITLAFMAFWKRQNFGGMANLFSLKMIDNPKVYAGELRAKFGSILVGRYKITKIVDEAPAIAVINVKVADSNGNETEGFWKFRLIHEGKNSNLVPANLEEGCWQILWLHNEKDKAEMKS
jgi:hypothetical protein